MSGISSSHGYEGQLVSKSHNVGFVVLSCLISFIGAASTLELINRRTGLRGWFNNLLLISSAVAMGGVGIWSMHFVANRAMELANGEPAMQISYSVGFTVLSFFVPIVVLLAAFVAIGSNERLSWWRISIGGIFCGGAVCGMHYLGNASIANYQCVYAKANVAGSAILAVAASTAALSMFFVFRATWANSWWKRILSAVILAGSVCGMHWCAALGTSYMLVSPKAKDTDASRNAPVIAVICLSIGACILMAGSAILKARSMSKSAQKAQQITLAAAVFDKQGRILVDTNGLMPSMVITNAFLEKNSQDGFSVSYPLFHWMLQASRNWAPVSSLIAGMKAHLEQVPKFGSGKNIRLGVDLVSTHGELMDNYAVIFRELFCVAASALAEALGEQLTSAGVLWDDILRTGVTHREHDLQWLSSADNRPLNDPEPNKDGKWPNVTEKSSFQSQMEYGRGSLMFLVRRVRTDRDTNRLASAGYRFAEVPQVSGLIKEGMQIQSSGIESRLREMAAYSNQPTEPQPGVCLGFFGIKARVDKAGFDILVQRQTRHLLPSTSLQLDMLKPWHIDFLRQFEGKCVAYVLDTLTVLGSSNSAPDECAFARQFSLSLRDLRAGIQDPLFDQAVISTTPVSIPSLDHRGVEVLTKLVAFRLLIPVHCVISSPSCELVPLNLFKVLQVSQKQQLYFTQSLHREFGPIVGGISENSVGHGGRERLRWSTLWGAAPSAPAHAKDDVLETREELSSTKSERRCSSCASLHTDSTAGLCKTGSVRCSEIDHDDTITTTQPFSGILVSQEITVHDGSDDELDSENRGTSRRFGASARGLAARAKFGIGIQKQSPTDIEMGPLEHDSRETDTRIGQAHIVGGHDKDLASLQTFVDVLFEQCIISHESKL